MRYRNGPFWPQPTLRCPRLNPCRPPTLPSPPATNVNDPPQSPQAGTAPSAELPEVAAPDPPVTPPSGVAAARCRPSSRRAGERASLSTLPPKPAVPRAARPAGTARGGRCGAGRVHYAADPFTAPSASVERDAVDRAAAGAYLLRRRFAHRAADDHGHRAAVVVSDFSYADTRSAQNVPTGAEIRLLHQEDEAAAGRLAALLAGAGREFQVRKWAEPHPSRPQGTLEVWLGP